jgi:hypothetical protein
MNPDIIQCTHAFEDLAEIDQNSIRDFNEKKITGDQLVFSRQQNLDRLHELIDQCGFPYIDKTSHQAYKGAILTILHSGLIDLMTETLKIIENAPLGAVEKRDMAYLIDKIRILQKRPQVYGTQYLINLEGVVTFVEIEDIANINRRRELFGMETFEEYKKLVMENVKRQM